VQLLEQRLQGQGQGLPVMTQIQQLPGLLQLQKGRVGPRSIFQRQPSIKGNAGQGGGPPTSAKPFSPAAGGEPANRPDAAKINDGRTWQRSLGDGVSSLAHPYLSKAHTIFNQIIIISYNSVTYFYSQVSFGRNTVQINERGDAKIKQTGKFALKKRLIPNQPATPPKEVPLSLQITREYGSFEHMVIHILRSSQRTSP
jgi:hypothetical protein